MDTPRQELEAQYENLTKRIAAVNSDIAKALDSEQKVVLQERLAELSKERDVIAVKLERPRTNGDLAALRSKIDDLATALEGNNPGKTHAIIRDCYSSLVGLDERVSGVEVRTDNFERRLDYFERRVDPPPSVLFWRAVSFATIILGVVIFSVPSSHYVFFTNPMIGISLEVLIAALSVMFWWVSRLTSMPRQVMSKGGRYER